MIADKKLMKEVVDEAVGRLTVVLAILKEHEDHCGPEADRDPDHPDGWDLAMAIESLRDIRESLREAHATATEAK